ncbi:DUF2188 domain-containing protein [Phenylobacterium sp. J426]|uniref:DUF2188 domain-containing protein n=1 Tax=Phenylobacterium sp. J426 TaxID=2898439 RepID=UPI002151560B|nr:DUF2188 domain-containing protein [Phenylobacterium sp. J426]MCR5874949.1 DUF2188 domain-containing protein [Phenylobacterium sp. J426]
MPQVHYGVVKQSGRWRIIGQNLNVGRYRRRESAIRAARRLAASSGGLAAVLHVQDEDGVLRPPEPADGGE